MLKILLMFLSVAFVAIPEVHAGSCCANACPEIIPCPPREVKHLHCDPQYQVYEIYGYLDYWTKLMRVERSCEDNPWEFQATMITEDSEWSPEDGCLCNLDRIILRPHDVGTIETTKVIAHQLKFERRRFYARGCFSSEKVFLAEYINFDLPKTKK